MDVYNIVTSKIREKLNNFYEALDDHTNYNYFLLAGVCQASSISGYPLVRGEVYEIMLLDSSVRKEHAPRVLFEAEEKSCFTHPESGYNFIERKSFVLTREQFLGLTVLRVIGFKPITRVENKVKLI